MKTCVLPFSRRNGLEWTMRSRSRWNGVRSGHGSSSRTRPRVSYERTASEESARSSCSRTRVSKASATRPASSGMRPSLEDDRDSAAARAPPGSRHVTGTVRAQKDDHRGDLLGPGEPSERPSRAHLLQHRLALALLVGETPLADPGLCCGRPGSDGVTADPVARLEVCDEA